MQWEIPAAQCINIQILQIQNRNIRVLYLDYIDQSIYKKDRYGKEFQAYGGDFGERPTDYNFSGNGIAYGGDRDASPKMQEVKIQLPEYHCAGK